MTNSINEFDIVIAIIQRFVSEFKTDIDNSNNLNLKENLKSSIAKKKSLSYKFYEDKRALFFDSLHNAQREITDLLIIGGANEQKIIKYVANRTDKAIKSLNEIKITLNLKEFNSDFHHLFYFDSIHSFKSWFDNFIIENNLSKQKTTITGFETTLSEPKQSKLYKALQNNYIDCSEVEFKAMFTNKPKPIKWIDKGTTRHEPNKQTIFEFIYLLKEYSYLKDYKTDLDKMPTNKNNLYRKLEYIFPDIKNFASSSGTGKSQKNTQRKNKLETIIKSL